LCSASPGRPGSGALLPLLALVASVLTLRRRRRG